ncbi:MAG: hypothetical protein ACT4PT_00355, partial [Methanobacteriota archaeon]
EPGEFVEERGTGLELVGVSFATTAGYLVATWGAAGARRSAIAAGLLLSGAGMITFLGAGIAGSGFDGGWVPTIVFASGMAVAGFGAVRFARGAGGAGWGMLRRGMALAALGAAVWIPVDFSAGVHWWQPGNLLALAGTIVVAASKAPE